MHQLPADINAYIAERLDEVLPTEARALLLRAAEIGGERGWTVYLAGGYVRDCLLGVPDYDIDVSVVGDAPRLAEAIAGESGAALEVHEEFGTAVLSFAGRRFHIDFVTARREWYERPGALPTVEFSSTEDDLARRDFTINAMAVAIATDPKSERFGPLLDPHGGIADLQSGLVRVLHPQSFLDDPTRIFRAVRLAKRLGFKIELGTLELILQAVRDGALATVSVERVTHELLLILEEARAGEMLAELDRLGVLSAVHPLLSWPYRDDKYEPSESEHLSEEDRRDTYLAIIAAELAASPGDAEALARWLRLPARQIRLMRDSARLAAVWSQLGEDNVKPSQTYSLLNDLEPGAPIAFTRIGALAQDSVAWSRLHDYLDTLRHVRTELNGDYLREEGVPPGPIYRQLLGEMLDAKLDGELPDRDGEIRFVKAWLARRDRQ